MRAVGLFLTIAFSIPWLLWLLKQGTGVDVIAPGGMLAVGLATLVTVRRFRIGDTGVARQPVRLAVAQSLAAVAGVIALAEIAVVIGAAAGVHRLDLTGYSALHQVYGDGPAAGVLLVALAQSSMWFVLVLPLAFCEEWGWRGFLLPRLLRFGKWAGLGLSGIIWAVWHLPGYVGSPAFVPFAVFTLLLGTLLGLLRMYTGSVWACAAAHAANNALVLGVVNVAVTDAAVLTAPDPWLIGLSGWPGWVTMATAIAVVTLVVRRNSVRPVPVAT